MSMRKKPGTECQILQIDHLLIGDQGHISETKPTINNFVQDYIYVWFVMTKKTFNNQFTQVPGIAPSFPRPQTSQYHHL